MHKQRWLTGMIALPILILLIVEGGVFFSLLLVAVALVGMGEFNKIQYAQSDPKPSRIITSGGYAAVPLMIAAAQVEIQAGPLCLLAGVILAGGIAALWRVEQARDTVHHLGGQILGLVYVAGPLVMLVLIRNAPQGAAWIFYLLMVIFAGDTGAYYVGSYWGKHKLCPRVSPKKTVEGALGGVFANLLAAALAQILFLEPLTLSAAMGLGILAGAAGQVGDLFESIFKRAASIKDSGTILPGHGGILDRIDALLFAIPVVYAGRYLLA